MKNQNIIFTTIAFLISCFAISPAARAVTPAPDGGYPGGNTAEGQAALLSLTTGGFNTAVGFLALRSDITAGFNTAVGAGTLLANMSDRNTATGAGALLSNTNAADNTANGAFALLNNTTGAANTAVGAGALFTNIGGSNNTALGVDALHNNTADGNTATGAFALHDNTTGGTLGNIQGLDVGPNVAVGGRALESNTVASANTAVGYQALHSFTTGPVGLEQIGASTAVGFQALADSDSGGANNAFGYQALGHLTDGGGNVAIGFRALLQLADGSANMAIGTEPLVDLTGGTNNLAVGYHAGNGLTNGDYNVYIGMDAGASSENSHTYIRNINLTPLSGGGTDTVTINLTTGLVGHLSSSRRYKEDIKPIEMVSEVLYRLNPVSYRYKKEIDSTQSPAFGLVAEEVAEVNPNLVAFDSEGQPESVHYEMVNAMLLNEFLKEHKKVEEQQATIAELKSVVAQQQKRFVQHEAQIAALASGLHKVSAQRATTSPSHDGLETSEPESRLVVYER